MILAPIEHPRRDEIIAALRQRLGDGPIARQLVNELASGKGELPVLAALAMLTANQWNEIVALGHALECGNVDLFLFPRSLEDQLAAAEASKKGRDA